VALIEALRIAERLERNGRLSGDQKTIPDDLRAMLAQSQQVSQ
jgi:hypothetical protein